ncbi:MAG: hypothetical protein ABIK33_04285 [candidate division WOR-3 bacterium]
MFITILLIISNIVNPSIHKENTEPIISPTFGPNTKQEEITNQLSTQAMPWDLLKSFTQAEKENTQITISLPDDANDKIRALSKEIEQQWKNHNYDNAFELFENLKMLINPALIEIGVSYLNPITNSDLWGSDKRVGSYDSLNTVCLDFEADSTKIFALVASRTRTTRTYQVWSLN